MTRNKMYELSVRFRLSVEDLPNSNFLLMYLRRIVLLVTADYAAILCIVTAVASLLNKNDRVMHHN